MIHVVDFEKTAFSTSFRGVLPPSGPQIIAESGMGYPLLGTRETWVVSTVLLAPVLPPRAPRRRPPGPAGQALSRPSAAGYCLTPTADLSKTQRDPISTSGPSIPVYHQPRRFLRTNRSVSSPLAAAQPLTILSW